MVKSSFAVDQQCHGTSAVPWKFNQPLTVRSSGYIPFFPVLDQLKLTNHRVRHGDLAVAVSESRVNDA